MTDRVGFRIDGHVCHVRLNRPDKVNALDSLMFAALAEAIDRIRRAPAIRAVVLAGEGRGFCAGLDMAAMAMGGSGFALADRAHHPANVVQHVAWGWRTLPVPVIAAVHGVAFGGGLQIMSGADIRIAHPRTRLSIREVHWGLVPDMAGIALWQPLVRGDRLRELTYTAREFDGEEAAGLGFATRTADDPLTEASRLAEAIAANSPSAVQAAKRLYNLATDADAETILRAESDAQIKLKQGADHREAITASREARKPVYRD